MKWALESPTERALARYQGPSPLPAVLLTSRSRTRRSVCFRSGEPNHQGDPITHASRNYRRSNASNYELFRLEHRLTFLDQIALGTRGARGLVDCGNRVSALVPEAARLSTRREHLVFRESKAPIAVTSRSPTPSDFGQAEIELRAAARLRIRPNAAAIPLDNLLTDSEA